MALYESQWNSVNLSNRKSKDQEPYKISTTSVSSSWYNRLLDGSGVRKTRLRHFYDMDKTVEINKALDILAEDISSENADNECALELEYDENVKFLKSTVKLLEGSKDLWMERSGFGTKLFDRVRETLKYGASFYKRKHDGSLRRIPAERIVGYVTDPEDEDLITHYIEDPSVQKFDDIYANRNQVSNKSLFKASKSDDYVIHSVDSLVVMKVGEGPYGQSVLESVFTVWRQLELLQQSLIIYRVVRAPEKRVYYIDVGNLSGPRRQQAIEQQRLRLMQKQTKKKGLDGSMDSEYDPHSTTEDIFIPTNSQGKGSRIETLQGGSNLGEIADVEFFVKKLAAGLRIPNSSIDSQGDQDRNTNSDMRVGTVYAVEMRYLGHVKRIARVLARTLNDEWKNFCEKRNVIVPQGITLIINDPNSYAKYKNMEVWQQQLNLFASSQQASSLSKKFILQKYMMMDQEELQQNETMKLTEMGVDQETIKKMLPGDIDNIVYGDKSRLKEYGIEPPEDDGFGGGRF